MRFEYGNKKNDDNGNKKRLSIKDVLNGVKNWLGFSFGLLAGIIVIVLTQINNSLSKANQPIVVIPWWIWGIIGGYFLLIGIIAILVIRISYEHHYTYHNEGTRCDVLLKQLNATCNSIPSKIQDPVSAICEECRQIHSENANDCSIAINKINAKVNEQLLHISSVDQLVANAQKLEKLYADAVSERLRTNKQVASIEAEAKHRNLHHDIKILI